MANKLCGKQHSTCHWLDEINGTCLHPNGCPLAVDAWTPPVMSVDEINRISHEATAKYNVEEHARKIATSDTVLEDTLKDIVENKPILDIAQINTLVRNINIVMDVLAPVIFQQILPPKTGVDVPPPKEEDFNFDGFGGFKPSV